MSSSGGRDVVEATSQSGGPGLLDLPAELTLMILERLAPRTHGLCQCEARVLAPLVRVGCTCQDLRELAGEAVRHFSARHDTQIRAGIHAFTAIPTYLAHCKDVQLGPLSDLQPHHIPALVRVTSSQNSLDLWDPPCTQVPDEQLALLSPSLPAFPTKRLTIRLNPKVERVNLKFMTRLMERFKNVRELSLEFSDTYLESFAIRDILSPVSAVLTDLHVSFTVDHDRLLTDVFPPMQSLQRLELTSTGIVDVRWSVLESTPAIEDLAINVPDFLSTADLAEVPALRNLKSLYFAWDALHNVETMVTLLARWDSVSHFGVYWIPIDEQRFAFDELHHFLWDLLSRQSTWITDLTLDMSDHYGRWDRSEDERIRLWAAPLYGQCDSLARQFPHIAITVIEPFPGPLGQYQANTREFRGVKQSDAVVDLRRDNIFMHSCCYAKMKGWVATEGAGI